MAQFTLNISYDSRSPQATPGVTSPSYTFKISDLGIVVTPPDDMIYLHIQSLPSNGNLVNGSTLVSSPNKIYVKLYHSTGLTDLKFYAKGTTGGNSSNGNYSTMFGLRQWEPDTNVGYYLTDYTAVIINATDISLFDKLRYFYKEDTNQILINSKVSENIVKNDNEIINIFQKYGEKIQGFGTGSLYSVRNGFDIPLRKDNALYLFYGNSKSIAGNNSLNNYYKYNKYLHKPYRIFALLQTGSSDSNGKNSTKLEKVYIDFKSTPFNSNNGSFIFNNVLNNDLRVEAKVNYISYDRNYVNPSSSLKTWTTASLNLHKGNSSSSLGSIIKQETIYGDNIHEGGEIHFTYEIPKEEINIGDKLTLSVSVDGPTDNIQSSLIIKDSSFKIVYEGSSSDTTVPTNIYFDGYNGFKRETDCNPILNNVDQYRPSENLYPMEFDYYYNNEYESTNSNPNIPSNWENLTKGTEKLANINPFLYSSNGLRNARYDGSFTTSKKINEFKSETNNEDILYAYGKLPNVEIRSAYFAYFNSIHDLYPLVNDKILFNVKYSIGPNGEISSPLMDETSNLNLINSLDNNFDNNNLNIYADSSKNTEFNKLNGMHSVHNVGYKPYPIFYSQTSSNGYSSELDLWGLKEKLGPQKFIDYSFMISGSESSIPTNTVSKNLSPNGGILYDSDLGTIDLLYTQGGGDDGLIKIPTDISGSEGAGIGKPLSNNYSFLFEHSFSTTYINDVKFETSYKKRKWFLGKKRTYTKLGIQEDVGLYEFWIKGKGLTKQNSFSVFTKDNPGDNAFTNELIDKTYYLKNVKVTMNVYYTNNSNPSGYDIKTFNVTDSFASINQKSEGHSVVINFNNDKIEQLLKKNSLSTNDIRKSGNLQLINWRIEGEVDDNIVQGSEFKAYVDGSFMPMEPLANQNLPNLFYPEDVVISDKEYTSFRLEGHGTKESKKLSLGNGKYWSFGSGSNGLKYNELYFNIENGNQIFGQKLKQVDIPYSGSGYLNFHGGVEPSFISFPKIDDPWEPMKGDEIRFGNNELYSYTILSVEGPNDLSNETNKLKLTVNRDINPNVDLNMFLIRRWKKEKGNVIVNSLFPYSNPPKDNNTQGFLFPEFMSEDINKNPDAILKELTDKGVIS